MDDLYIPDTSSSSSDDSDEDGTWMNMKYTLPEIEQSRKSIKENVS